MVCLVLASFFEKIYIDREVVQEASAVLLCVVDGLKETSFSILNGVLNLILWIISSEQRYYCTFFYLGFILYLSECVFHKDFLQWRV